MGENFKAKLWVNKRPTKMNPFVEEFVARTTVASVTPLKGIENIKKLEVHQKKGLVEITVNGKDIPITAFPNDIICNTLTGMVSTLEGAENIDSIDIDVEVE